MAERLRDIIDVPDIKTVIELDDADRDPDGIIANFVITDDIQESLRIILKRIDDSKGCGIFIKGGFGSGKSHLLSYLYLLFKNKNLSILNDYSAIRGRETRVVKVSLIKYPAHRSLESIVLSCLGFTGAVVNREEVFKQIIDRDTIIIIDELSEFLRSKPAPPAFYEDTRFLQFLGEFSFRNPLWIIASLQEWIEETGHISAATFTRIKDRYPLRIPLTSSHIEDIIDKRIILKREGSQDILQRVFSGLRNYFPHIAVTFEDFRKTYPLHPITVRFLAGLTPVFSQNRGIIQFVISAVRGILDEPPDSLITPEMIFDHFEERIREIPDYSRLSRVVYDYYRMHLNEIFSHENQKASALSAIKVLILTEISPLEKKKTYRDIAEILLKKVSTITSEINYEFVKDGVLEPLVAHQMYIIKEGDRYLIDPKVDAGIRIKGRIKAFRERLADGNFLFTEICSRIDLPYLPLKDLVQGRRYKFLWQNSLRECAVILLLQGQLRKEEIDRMLDSLGKRLDGYLVVVSPFFEEKERIYTVKEAYSSAFLSSLLFWIPSTFTKEDVLFFEEFVAKQHLLREFPELQSDIKRDEPVFKEMVSNAFFSGEIVYGSGRVERNLKQIGYLPIERLLGHLFDQSLTEIHPQHFRIMPRVDYYSSHHIGNLFAHCIRKGKITIDEAEKKGLMPYINGLLEPMGIVKKRGGNFLMTIDAENDLVAHVLNILSHEEDLGRITAALRKGVWGMSDAQVHLVISALIASGSAVPHRGDEVVELNELSQLQTGEITRIKQSKGLSPQLLGFIQHGKFIWGEVEHIPTPVTQKKMWKDTSDLVRRTKKMLEETAHLAARYKDYSVFKKLNIRAQLLNRLSLFLNSLTLSLSPPEGIERALLCLQENPSLGDDVQYLEHIHRFLTEDFQTINKYYLYLTHNSLKVAGRLESLKNSLLARIEEFLCSPQGDVLVIKDAWDEFFGTFSDAYREGHEIYYNAAVFSIKKETEASPHAAILRKITTTVTSAVFEPDWWEIRRDLESLPDTCVQDVQYEIFLQPVCRCGYKIGDEPPTEESDFVKKCEQGILHFLSQIQKPEYRERIESYILGSGDVRHKETFDTIASLLSLNPETVNLSLALPLLTDNTLKEIENALKGRWKTKEVSIEDLIGKVKGRRLKYSELKDILLRWIGDDEESIVFVTGEESANVHWLAEDLAKYGIHGERLFSGIAGYGLREAEEKLTQEGVDRIKWQDIAVPDLFRFLDAEKLSPLKKRLREEIFYRLWGRQAENYTQTTVSDPVTRDMLTVIGLSGQGNRFKGGELFTNVIAPMSLVISKLEFENEMDEKLSHEVIGQMRNSFDNMLTLFGGSAERYEGVRNISYVTEHLRGVVVIFDGLRYDLWGMLREAFVTHGCVIKDEPFMVSPPSTTNNFRKAVGIEERGVINGREYVLLKWAEKGIGRKGVKNILKDKADIKFLHFNFVDVKAHASSMNPYPLYAAIMNEFTAGILPVLKDIPSFLLLSDHGFTDTGRLKERYTHGGNSVWETILPFAEIKSRI